MCLNSSLIFTLVDSFYGGNGQGKSAPAGTGRPLTPTEKRIVERCLERAFKALIKAWSTIYTIEPTFIRQEVNTQITSPANPSEVTITSKFKVSLALGSGEFHLAIPYPSLDPVRSYLTATMDKPRENDSRWSSEFADRVFESPLEIQGIIAETEITLSDLLSLKLGDFIPLGQTQSAQFYAEGIPLFEAAIGVSNGMISAQLPEPKTEQRH
jgi:flagellar motor switch protein FliM